MRLMLTLELVVAVAVVAVVVLAAAAVDSRSGHQVRFDIDEDALIEEASVRADYYSLHLDDGRGTASSYVIKSNSNSYSNSSQQQQQILGAASKAMDEQFKHLEETNDFAVKYIWRRMPIGFLVLGTIANILSIIVFTRKEMRKYSSFCYFAVLNVVNLAFLYVTLTRVIMDFNFKSDIRTLNIFTCKSHVFLTYFLGHLSSLLLSTISIDRVISVVFLHRAKELCTPRVAFMVTAFLIAFNCLVSSHLIIFDSAHTVDTHINITLTNAKKVNNKSLLTSMSTAPVDLSATTLAAAAAASLASQHQHHHHQQRSHKSRRELTLKEKFEFKDMVEHEYGLDVSNLVPSSSELAAGEGFFGNEIVESKVVCDTRNGTFYHSFIRNTWKLIDMSLYAFLPFAIMFTCSVIIIIRVAQQSNKFKARTYKGTSQKQKKSSDMNRISSPNISQSAPRGPDNNSNRNKASITHKLAEQPTTTLGDHSFQNDTCDASSSMRSSVNGLERAESVHGGKLKPSLSLAPTTHIMNRNSIGTSPIALAKLRSASSASTPATINPNHRPSEAKFSTRTRNLALMLIPVNVLFLMFLSPVVICMYTYDNLGNDQLTLAIVEHLSYCNFSLNFFIYFLTSSKFREEFFKFLNETFRTSTLQNHNNNNNNNSLAYANTSNRSSCFCFKWRLPFLKHKSSSPAPGNGGAGHGALGKTRYQSINTKSSIKPPNHAANAPTLNVSNATYTPLSGNESKQPDQSKSSPRLASKFNQLINSKNKDDDELVAMTTTYLSGNEPAE